MIISRAFKSYSVKMLRRKLGLSNTLNGIDVNEESPPKRPKATDDLIVTSKFFSNPPPTVNESLLLLSKSVNDKLKDLKFGKPVEYIYNPLEYAFNLHSQYINKFCSSPKQVLFVGMNPGPFGMCQTGVPFGDIPHVRDWLKINGEVSKPEKECPSRPILGLECQRTEISGKQFWGLFERICGVPDAFFRNAFVYNYCPLAFMKGTGSNITPNMIKVLDH